MIMLNFKKLLISKFILIAAVVTLCANAAYLRIDNSLFYRTQPNCVLETSFEKCLRKPLDFNGEDFHIRWHDGIEKIVKNNNPPEISLIFKEHALGSGNDTVPLPLLFYEKQDLGFNSGFMASNEYDWYEQEIDTREADIFLGIGNNTVYDLAVRRNSKIMIIGDYDEDVIAAHEYLYKPLILIARSPNEFISMLAGVPIPRELNNASLKEVFYFIDNYLKRYPENRNVLLPGRVKYVEKIIEKIKNNPLLGESHALFVGKYLKWRMATESGNTYGYSGVFSENLERYHEVKGNLYYSFNERYNPEKLINEGAEIEKVTNIYFSSFSSMQAFMRLKNLFKQGRVYYFVADVTDRRAYKAIGEFAKKTGRKISGFSMCNVIDCLAQDAKRRLSIMARILNMMMGEADIDPSFTVYNTYGTQLVHSYKARNIKSPEFLKFELLKYSGFSEDVIDSRNDLEIAIDVMNTEQPKVMVKVNGIITLYFSNSKLQLNISNYFYERIEGFISGDKLIFSSETEKQLLEALINLILLDMKNNDPEIEDYLERFKINHPDVKEQVSLILSKMPVDYPDFYEFLQKHRILRFSLNEKINQIKSLTDESL